MPGFLPAGRARPKSSRALVSDWLGRKVEVIQFAGAWLPLPVDQRTRARRRAEARRLEPARRRCRDRRAGLGPAGADHPADRPARPRTFETLLPDRVGLQRLVSMVRAFLGFETGFAINPVLARAEVPPLRLDTAADPAPRLGWNTWSPPPGLRARRTPRGDAADALFEAELVEAVEHGMQ